MDKQDSLMAAGLNNEVAAFKLDAKSAITAILTETVKASNFAVNGSIANAITFSAGICDNITLGVTWLEYWYRPALMNKYVTDFVVTVKGNFSKPVNELKNQAVATILANPKAQSCIEKAAKDIPILSSNVKKILTSTFLTASNNFTSSSKVMHGYIKNNVTLIVKSFDDCLKLKPTPIVFNCIDNLVSLH